MAKPYQTKSFGTPLRWCVIGKPRASSPQKRRRSRSLSRKPEKSFCRTPWRAISARKRSTNTVSCFGSSRTSLKPAGSSFSKNWTPLRCEGFARRGRMATVPRVSKRYFFWTGDSKLPTATGHWQAKLKKVFELREVRDGHAHRFPDTFAVELLLAGVPLERVSVMLGHTSIKVTERHYAPWVLARQEQAEADVRRAWSQDPVALLEMKGTLEVHEKRGVVN